jgi:hypothetical protein
MDVRSWFRKGVCCWTARRYYELYAKDMEPSAAKYWTDKVFLQYGSTDTAGSSFAVRAHGPTAWSAILSEKQPFANESPNRNSDGDFRA